MASGMGRRGGLLFWFIIYEMVSWLVAAVSGFITLRFGHARPVESIGFIFSRDPLNAVVCTWLSNTSSFFLGAVLVIINPFLGLLSVAYLSLSLGDLLASWLAGYCPTPHLIYGVVETQAYVLLWLLAVRTYLSQRLCGGLTCRWLSTVSQVKRLLPLATASFLVLAAVEVAEVLTYG